MLIEETTPLKKLEALCYHLINLAQFTQELSHPKNLQALGLELFSDVLFKIIINQTNLEFFQRNTLIGGAIPTLCIKAQVYSLVYTKL